MPATVLNAVANADTTRRRGELTGSYRGLVRRGTESGWPLHEGAELDEQYAERAFGHMATLPVEELARRKTEALASNPALLADADPLNNRALAEAIYAAVTKRPARRSAAEIRQDDAVKQAMEYLKDSSRRSQ